MLNEVNWNPTLVKSFYHFNDLSKIFESCSFGYFLSMTVKSCKLLTQTILIDQVTIVFCFDEFNELSHMRAFR